MVKDSATTHSTWFPFQHGYNLGTLTPFGARHAWRQPTCFVAASCPEFERACQLKFHIVLHSKRRKNIGRHSSLLAHGSYWTCCHMSPCLLQVDAVQSVFKQNVLSFVSCGKNPWQRVSEAQTARPPSAQKSCKDWSMAQKFFFQHTSLTGKTGMKRVDRSHRFSWHFEFLII